MQHVIGHTWHGRKGEIKNDFRYGVDYILFDPESEHRLPWYMTRNRAGIVSIHDRDYGGPPKAGTGVVWARAVFAEHAPQVDGAILLLTQPRVLGYVFNPITLWIGLDPSGQPRALIAEVTNTFGDRHSYVVRHSDGRPIEKSDRITARKIMHVSPFQEVAGTYTFRFDLRDEAIGLWIEYKHDTQGVMATLSGARRPISAGRFALRALRRPFGSMRVMALIHWQALVLKLKGARYRPQPEPPQESVSPPLYEHEK